MSRAEATASSNRITAARRSLRAPADNGAAPQGPPRRTRQGTCTEGLPGARSGWIDRRSPQVLMQKSTGPAIGERSCVGVVMSSVVAGKSVTLTRIAINDRVRFSCQGRSDLCFAGFEMNSSSSARCMSIGALNPLTSPRYFPSRRHDKGRPKAWRIICWRVGTKKGVSPKR